MPIAKLKTTNVSSRHTVDRFKAHLEVLRRTSRDIGEAVLGRRRETGRQNTLGAGER
jgi:hypothetical protein